MPRTSNRSSPRLSIEINNLQPTYYPGDTLQGYVTSDKPGEKQYVNPLVQIKLFARAKTKYTVSSSNGTSISRGRAVLFERRKVLHKGPICGDGQNAWNFSMTIPETSLPGFGARGDLFKESAGYLHTTDPSTKQETDVTKHALPSIIYYYSTSRMSGKTVEAYIEYVLLAQTVDAEACLPLYVRQRSVPSPITDYRLRSTTFSRMIKSWSLLPEFAGKPIAPMESMKRSLKRVKTPQYTYTVKVTFPTIIQLEHPEPIPFTIFLIPNLDPQKTTICPDGNVDTLPTVEVTSMAMNLLGDVSVRCPGTFWDTGTEKNHTFKMVFGRGIKPVVVPIIHTAERKSSAPLPDHQAIQETLKRPSLITSTSAPGKLLGSSTTDQEPGEVRNDPLDLGKRFTILLGCSASSTLNDPPISFKRQVYPTFATYNITMYYKLHWTIKLSIAKEEYDVSGNYPVKVLAPSEEQEGKKVRELGTAGMKKNYDDLEAGAGQAIQFIGQILQAVL